MFNHFVVRTVFVRIPPVSQATQGVIYVKPLCGCSGTFIPFSPVSRATPGAFHVQPTSGLPEYFHTFPPVSQATPGAIIFDDLRFTFNPLRGCRCTFIGFHRFHKLLHWLLTVTHSVVRKRFYSLYTRF